jgi:hypothetical protein
MNKPPVNKVFKLKDEKIFKDCCNIYGEVAEAFGFKAEINMHINSKNIPKIFFVTIGDQYNSRFFRSLTLQDFQQKAVLVKYLMDEADKKNESIVDTLENLSESDSVFYAIESDIYEIDGISILMDEFIESDTSKDSMIDYRYSNKTNTTLH